MRSRLTAVAVSLTLSLTGAATAHATAQTPANPPTIFMLDTLRDAGNNPHLVYTSCGDDNRALIHTVLYNDHGGPDETVTVYLEPNNGSGLNTLGIPVQNAQAAPSPIDIPAGGHVAITLPYENGNAVFDAVAVAQGGTIPTTTQQLAAAETAKTADNSQLFPPGKGTNGKYEYAIAPTACTPPPQTACPPNWPINPYPIEDPACIPHPGGATATVTTTVTETATKQIHVPGPTVTKTAVKTATATSTVTTTAPGSTTTVTANATGGGPFPGDQATDSTTPVGNAGLAHTGTSVVPLATVTVVLLLCGLGAFFGAFLMSRRARH